VAFASSKGNIIHERDKLKVVGADKVENMLNPGKITVEDRRLQEDARREKNWKRWGPYLSERQWGTVREDYSADGKSWEFFLHDHARSRVYRWGEDGLLGICDRQCRLCFALCLWNGRDPILKERLFGLTGPEGNHGEDVKEVYFYLDSTPTHSYMKALYKYPQAEFPYDHLVEENRRRSKKEPEFELMDTGVFAEGRYFDVFVEYAKAAPEDILIRITVANRGPDSATLHLLPTLWFRNTWSWGDPDEDREVKPRLELGRAGLVRATHSSLGNFCLTAEPSSEGDKPVFLFTENETNTSRLFDKPNIGSFVKDAFHEFVIHGRNNAVNDKGLGTKTAAYYKLTFPPGRSVTVALRLFAEAEAPNDGQDFERVFADRIQEADEYYAAHISAKLGEEERRVARQAYAGLLWSRKFYYYVVENWLRGDPKQPPPPRERKKARNHDWNHLYSRDVISMPDTWEYPWFAAWDLAFHMVPFSKIDPDFAKHQLQLFLREWYMHPNGQIPAYEYNFGDVNPPVHAWACWRVYKMTGPRGRRDRLFLSRVFQKLLINFTWWVNRKDVLGQHLFSGGFLGLDNIGVFDRSKPLTTRDYLAQADGTAWMAFFCSTMLAMALELALEDSSYEDIASKFFEHFVAIADAMNTLGGTGLWDEVDGFYYDQLYVPGSAMPLRVRSIVGIIPLFAVENLENTVIDRLPGFRKRMQWFLDHRQDLARHISYCNHPSADGKPHEHRLLAIPSRERLERVLRLVLDEREFLAPYGIRALSRIHKEKPFVFRADGVEQRVEYLPGESDSWMFGGNSNWRGPIWFPVNYLLIEALERYHHFYEDRLQIECPTGSGQMMNLAQVAREIARRLVSLFLPDSAGRRPCHGDEPLLAKDPHWRELVLFHEYFNGDNGQGLGASHQTGWTALVTRLLDDLGRRTPDQTVPNHQEPLQQVTQR
jgi:hypothetical protein